ncbi:hypothetical protein [uncultured Mediterranean phage uvMED]|nr:hypothetical protein [uncultured Mediterranean phage uvMED]
MIQEITIEEMAQYVEQYIYEAKGVRIKLIMNPRSPRQSFKMLSEAYNMAVYYNRFYKY